MDRARVSALTHGDLPFHNPLEAARVDEALARCGLEPGARVLDVGCGAGELLVRAADRHGATGFGFDTAQLQVDEATRRACERVPDAGLRFDVADDGSTGYDLVACIGSMHAVEGGLRELARRGRTVLVGDGFWRHEPGQPYLDALGGATADELPYLDGLLRAGDDARLEAAWLAVTTDEEWDRYEWTLISNGLASGDPDAIAWARRARERVLAPGGRDTLGFALIVFRPV